jgi:serine/threonine-protein kinase
LNGSFLGTPSHCAPEQVFGHEVDARTDVYSLGATAYQMLTGAPPFVGDVPEILSSKATEDAPDLESTGVPAAVAYTIRHMLAREPRHRAPSMAWVLEQLASWPQPGEPGAASHARIPARPGSAVPTADHHTEPEVRIRHEDDGDPAGFGRADTTAAATSEDLDPATANDAMRALAPPRGRLRWRTALVISGGALVGAALIVRLGAPVFRSTTPTSSWPAVQAAPAGSATARAVTPPAAPLDPQAPSLDASTTAPTRGSAAPATASAEPAHVEGAGSDAGDASPTSRPEAGSASGRSDRSPDPAAYGRPVARHPSAKPASDKKPPMRKPPARKPPPGDVLIVDPFSHGTSPRSDSP